MQNLPRKRMGLGLVALSMLFLWNPDVLGVFDLLPDVIGYILLSLGLSSLSYLNHHFEESAKRFHRMIALSLARLLFVLVLFGLVGTADRPTTILLGNFVFGVLELMTLLPAYKQLFEGFLYAGSRGGIGESVFRPTAAHRLWSVLIRRRSEFDPKNHAVSVTESTALVTSLFVILKAVLSVLPEFAVLTDGVEGKVNLYAYIWLFRVASMLAGTVIGVLWLILVLRYFSRMLRDKPYIDYLHERYMQDIYPNAELFVAKKYKLGAFFLLLGVMLSLDLPMDGVNILPDVLCAAFLLAGVMTLRHHLSSRSTWMSASCVIGAYGLVSLFESYWQYRYFMIKEYSAAAALNGEAATDAYIVMLVLCTISSATFVLAMICVLNCLKDIIRTHAGYVSSHVDMQTYGRKNALQQQLIRGLTPITVMSVICAVGSVVYAVILPHASVGGEWYNVLASVMWLVNLVLGAVLVVVFVEKNGDITEQLNNRYLLAVPPAQKQQTE